MAAPATRRNNGFRKDMNAIRVENIPLNVNRREVIALFHTLIGEVRGSSDVMAASGSHLEIYFHSSDAAKKALCMSGYTIAGTALVVTAVEQSRGTFSPSVVQDNERRNLYVLGLPYDLTKPEFTALFARHGTVSHCVILATVDNASRRRGFVVMSSNEEAGKVIAALNRTQIRGHTLDISWAIVQRSQGFLDGGDRTLFSDLRPVESTTDSTDEPVPSMNSDSLPDLSNPSPSPVLTTLVPTSTIIVTDLPAVLFSEEQDLKPLFFPFGQICKLDIMPYETEGSITVTVEYHSIDSAVDAKTSLDGQHYMHMKVNVRFVRPATQHDLEDNPDGLSNTFNDGLSSYDDSFSVISSFRPTYNAYQDYRNTSHTFPQPIQYRGYPQPVRPFKYNSRGWSRPTSALDFSSSRLNQVPFDAHFRPPYANAYY